MTLDQFADQHRKLDDAVKQVAEAFKKQEEELIKAMFAPTCRVGSHKGILRCSSQFFRDIEAPADLEHYADGSTDLQMRLTANPVLLATHVQLQLRFELFVDPASFDDPHLRELDGSTWDQVVWAEFDPAGPNGGNFVRALFRTKWDRTGCIMP